MEQVWMLELNALGREFDCLCRRWSVTADERERLVGPEHEGEREKRVLLEIDRHMRLLIGEEEVSKWLRGEGENGLSPLEFMGLGRDERSAMLAAARQRFAERFPQDVGESICDGLLTLGVRASTPGRGGLATGAGKTRRL